MMRILLLLIGFVLMHGAVIAQHPDTLIQGATGPLIFHVSDQAGTTPDYQIQRTNGITGLQYEGRPWYFEIGNRGQSAYPLLYRGKQSFGFTTGLLPGLRPQPDLDKLKYFHVTVPYTVAGGQVGTQTNEGFSVLHTQNVKPNWNIALDIKRFNSIGFYTHQQSTRSLFRAQSNYRSLNQRYQLFADFIVGNYTNQENGGIEGDTLFTENIEDTRAVIPVGNTTAFNNRKNNTIQVRHYLNFGPTQEVGPDTARRKQTTPVFRLGLIHRMENARYRYRDDAPDTTYYDTFLLSSTYTNDLTQSYQWYNEARVEKLLPKEKNGIGLFFGAAHRYVEYSNRRLDTIFRNVLVNGGARFRIDSIDLFATADYALAGSNAGDFRIEARASMKLGGFFDLIQASARQHLHEADFMTLRFAGNHDWWQNDFEKLNTQHLELNVQRTSQLKIGASFDLVDGLIYFDTLAQPQQQNSTASILRLSVSQKIDFLKRVHFRYSGHFQNVAGVDELRLPELMAKGSLYFERPVFKSALTLQFGVDATWFSAFQANAYRPTSGVFHLQNELTVGNYPYFDFFVNGRIGKVRFYTALTHLNSGLMGYDYWATLGYPAPDRAFKIGLNWQFFD